MIKPIIHAFLGMIMLLNFGFSSPAQAVPENEPDQYVQISIVTDKTTVESGDTIRVGVVQNIYPKWHTYWKNPGDSGTPTSISWELPEGFSASEFDWPTPLKIPFGPLTNYGYEGEVTLLQNLTLPETITDEPITLNGRVDLLVCHDICIPESHNVSLTLNGDELPQPEAISEAETKLPTVINSDAQFRISGENVEIELGENNNLSSSFFIAPEEWGIVANTAEASIDGSTVTQKVGDREWDDVPEQANFVFVEGDQSYLVSASKSAKVAPTIPAQETQGSNITALQAIIFAFLGGLILNLMPCVFPVLSIKALSLVKLGKSEEKKARQHGLSYTAGILLSFGIIAGALIALKASGAQIGWGFHLQNPMIISLLIYLVFIIGLNLIGVFEFANPFANTGQKLTQSDGNKGAFFTGVLATLVATPCTAPFMAGAIGFALTQPAIISMTVFLSLGLGLAAPYLALCFSPALRHKLPKPGAWMEKFKELLAFPMFITAAWLTWVLAQQSNSTTVFCLLVSLTLIAFMFWLYKSIPAKGILRYISKALIVISILFVISTLIIAPQERGTGNVSPVMVNEEAFTLQKLNDALAGDEGIFTDMTAAWCITCKVNERVALKTDAVQSIFKEHNIQFMVGDWTNQDPEITKYLKSYGRSGVPLYVFYPPRDASTGERPEPIVLPQILTPNLVVKTLNKGLGL